MHHFPPEKLFIAQGSPGTLGGTGPLPLGHHRLLAAQGGAGSVDGGHAKVGLLLVLVDHVVDAAEGGWGLLVDGGATLEVAGLHCLISAS